VAIRADHTSKSSIGNLRKQAADVWCCERAVLNSRHVDPHSPCHFISCALIPYTAQMKRSCVKGRPEAVNGVPRAGSWSDRTSGDKAPLSVSVHAAAEPSRLVTYDNATVGAAAVRQLHKRARRGHPPARRGLSRYLPAILLFARSLFFLSRHLSRRCLGVNSVQRWPPSLSLCLTK